MKEIYNQTFVGEKDLIATVHWEKLFARRMNGQ